MTEFFWLVKDFLYIITKEKYMITHQVKKEIKNLEKNLLLLIQWKAMKNKFFKK